MRFPLKMAALALPLLVAACTTMPSGPGVMVLPGSKSYAQFRTDDMECRNYALESVGGITSSQAATESGVGSAVVGTVVGAAAGAAMVSRPGCRVYVGNDAIPKVMAGMGTSILSTPRGIQTGKQAKNDNVGGEVLCHVW